MGNTQTCGVLDCTYVLRVRNDSPCRSRFLDIFWVYLRRILARYQWLRYWNRYPQDRIGRSKCEGARYPSFQIISTNGLGYCRPHLRTRFCYAFQYGAYCATDADCPGAC
ncbi:hypothetical protein D3C72_1449600 [compost metagenome]